MRVAALDLGSNTSLLLIADVIDGQIAKVHHDESTVTKLGQGVHGSKRFHPEALARMDACLGNYARILKSFKVDRVVAVATSAARDVSNGEALKELGRKHGIPIEIISGAREAELTYLGARSGDLFKNKNCGGVIDVGGGSTEIIGGENLSGGVRVLSLDIGSVRLTELLVRAQPILAGNLTEIKAYIARVIGEADLPEATGEIVAVSGTPTTLAALEQRRAFDAEQIEGYVLTLDRIRGWGERLAALDVDARERLPGMQPKRSDVIPVGALILAGVLEALKQKQVSVSVRGVRYGVALSWSTFAV